MKKKINNALLSQKFLNTILTFTKDQNLVKVLKKQLGDCDTAGKSIKNIC